jgi:hypothetical protein
MQFLKNLVFPGGFMPHGNCYLWTPSLIGLHVVSDFLSALSYLSIPITLVHLTFLETVHTLARYWLLVNQPLPRQTMPDRTEKPA